MTKVKFEVHGGKELAAKLRAMGEDAKAVLVKAAQAGADVVRDAANSAALGPHIITDVTSESATEVEVSVGPDKAHWYYRFFEYGAGPHEIIAGASARREVQLKYGGKARRSSEGKAELQEVTERSNLIFFGDRGPVVIHQVSHPGMAARPFLRPAIDNKKTKAVGVVMDKLKDAIDKSVG